MHIRVKEFFAEYDLLTALGQQKDVWNSATMVSGEQYVTTCSMIRRLQLRAACSASGRRTWTYRNKAKPNIGGALCSTPHFGWCPLLECRAVTLPRRETRWNYLGCPKLTKRSQPYCGGHVEDILLLNNFFPIVDPCRSCEDIAQQSCAMVPRWRFLSTFCVMYLQRAASSTFQTCILNSH